MWKFRKPLQKFIKKKCPKILNMRINRKKQKKLYTLKTPKIQSTNICNMQRIKTSDKRFLFICGDRVKSRTR